MARHFFQSTRPFVRVARNNIEIFATLAAMAAAAVVPLPPRSFGDGSGRHVRTVEVRPVRVVDVRLTVADEAAVNRRPR